MCTGLTFLDLSRSFQLAQSSESEQIDKRYIMEDVECRIGTLRFTDLYIYKYICIIDTTGYNFSPGIAIYSLIRTL